MLHARARYRASSPACLQLAHEIAEMSNKAAGSGATGAAGPAAKTTAAASGHAAKTAAAASGHAAKTAAGKLAAGAASGAAKMSAGKVFVSGAAFLGRRALYPAFVVGGAFGSAAWFGTFEIALSASKLVLPEPAQPDQSAHNNGYAIVPFTGGASLWLGWRLAPELPSPPESAFNLGGWRRCPACSRSDPLPARHVPPAHPHGPHQAVGLHALMPILGPPARAADHRPHPRASGFTGRCR